VRATRFLKTVAPEIYVKGGDYTSDTLNAEERAVMEKSGTEIRFIPFEPGYSTSQIIELLKGVK
jgi:ADP-heptose synthase, bifunctional sugar kinase/adenylyltransferase